YKEAIHTFKSALKEKSDFWEAYNKMAYAKIKMEDYTGADKDLLKADKIAPLNYETDKLRGINYFLNHQYKACKEMLDTAVFLCLEDKLEDAELFYYRAKLMFVGKSYKPALEACEVALEWRPRYVDVIKLKADIRFAKKEYNYAIKELNDAIAMMPKNKIDFQSYKLRAKSKFEVGDFKGAVKDWDIYMDTIPPQEEDYVSRGAAKINANDNSGAIVDLDAAIKMNGRNPVSYCYRGTAKGGTKSYEAAIKDLDFAIKLKFDYASAYVNRAAIKMAIRDKRGACTDLEKADGLGSELALKLIQQYCK
ncbi:MAG: hypothetical protein WCR21_10550, partial [Bacteroidota bacterium]